MNIEERKRAFFNWSFEQVLLYGDAFVVWWKEEGADAFLKWAEKKGIKYMEVPK